MLFLRRRSWPVSLAVVVTGAALLLYPLTEALGLIHPSLNEFLTFCAYVGALHIGLVLLLLAIFLWSFRGDDSASTTAGQTANSTEDTAQGGQPRE